MSILQDVPWQCKYTPSDGDLLQKFYIPVLRCAVRYDRTTGFFSAETLAAASLGVEELVRNNGRMRLIAGCTLDEEEVSAIRKGESLRDTVEASLLRSPFGHDSDIVRDGLELLAWMVANGYLEVRVAVPCDPATGQPCPGHALFHEKAGIVEDKTGDRLVFNGSLNETLSGWTRNWDTFHVFRSWKDDAAHLDADEHSFQRLWANREPTAIVLELGQALRQSLLHFMPAEGELPKRLQAHKPAGQDGQEKAATAEPVAPVTEDADDIFKKTWQFIHEAPARPHGGERVGEATAAVVPWPHQVHAFHRMYDSWPPKLLIADEVGLGKTVQAGMLLRQAWLSGKARRILILAPKAVLRQWQIELREKFNLNVPIYEDRQLQWFPSPALQGRETCAVEDDAWHKQPIVLASSHLMRRKERVRQLEEAEPWDIVVLDEAHHARRKGGIKLSKDTPNQLLHLMRRLKTKTQGLILLTATPMQVAPLEVWDLLSLLDMPAEWTADQFLKFFELAVHPAPDEKDLAFMARLFRVMEAHYAPVSLEDAIRLEPNHRKIIANKVLKALRDRSTIPLKMLQAGERRYALALMRSYSPTRVLISRHTRELLRRYHQADKLATRIATRNVTDLLVTPSPAERMLYDDVEDYISSTYDNASKNERTAVGFVMTIYRRRLASSFYALEQTLQKRLDMLEQRASVTQLSFEDIPDDDLEDDVLDSDDAEKLEKKALRQEEAHVIRKLLEDTKKLPVDTKVQSLITVIDKLQHDGYRQVIVFTQYTDSLDFLRQQLVRHRKPGSILCFSGRGGERWSNQSWEIISREKTKQLFREGEAEILLCTDAAAEGLNFQFCGALINYDMPWNPMKVEQRIGRIDRLGQQFETIRIINLMYADTVEADIYQTLRNRIGLFGAFVGKLQPILSRLPRAFSELALVSRERQEAARAQAIADIQCDIQTQEHNGFDLDELSLSSLEMPERAAPLYDLAYLDRVLKTPGLLPPGYEAAPLAGGKDYRYVIPGRKEPVRVTTDPAFYEEHAESVELWSPGSPAFPW